MPNLNMSEQINSKNSEGEFYKTLNNIHDGETQIVADSVAFIAEKSDDVFCVGASLIINDVTGKGRIIYLPADFFIKFITAAYKSLDGDRIVRPEGRDTLEMFKAKYRECFYNADDAWLKMIYETSAVSLISSNQEAVKLLVEKESREDQILDSDLLNEPE